MVTYSEILSPIEKTQKNYMNIIELQNVTKSFQESLFRQRIILKDINLTIKEGDFVILRGASGAGKSTLIKIILGLQKANSGSVQLFGKSPKSPLSKLEVGTVFQEVTPPNSLTVKELINLVGSYYPNAVSTQKIIETFGLNDKQNSFPSDLAGGQKQRLYFALALVGNPKLLILDESTKNLDADGQKVFWQQIEDYRKAGMTILVVTHIESDQDKLEPLATRIITIENGKLIDDKQLAQTPQSDNRTITSQPSPPLKVFINQTWAEILQLWRTPLYLGGIILFSCLVGILPLNGSTELVLPN